MHLLKPLGLVFAFCVAGDLFSACIGRFLPGNVLGMLLLLVLLVSGKLKEERIRAATDFFEHNMPIFFLPTCLGILELSAEVRAVLAPIAAVVILTTVLTAAATAFTVRLVAGWESRRKEVGKC